MATRICTYMNYLSLKFLRDNSKRPINWKSNEQHQYISRQIAKCMDNDIVSPTWPQLWMVYNDIVSGTGCESESLDQGRSYSQTNISISGCFFSRSSQYSGSGGVIYVSGGSYSMNANFSMFFNCVCSSTGGAIYFNSYSSCLRMICANSCSCGSADNGNYAYIRASQINQLEYLSVSYCSPTISGQRTIYFSIGNQKVDNTNSSMNNVIFTSGILIDTPSSFTSSHCTFSNNIVTDFDCISFWENSGIMQFTNIVHNNSPSRYGVVDIYGSFSIKYAIFYNNQNTLFSLRSGSLLVSHSFISHSGTFSTSTMVSTTNNTITKRQTYQLQFFNSHYCNADFPLMTPLSTIEPSPHITPYRSYGEQSAHQTLFPVHSPHQTLFPEPTPPSNTLP